uniref:Chorion peroxidase n=1 Tax=Clastoptera arizonana TaxID=38151 RepID=A0A1B6C2W3_9HEMI
MVNERTPLRKGVSPPPYVFMTNPNRVYRKQVKQFQCCICSAILLTFISALIISITYSVDNDILDNPPESPVDNTSVVTLLSQSFPLTDTKTPSWNMATVEVEDLKSALAEGKASLEAKDKLEALNKGIPKSSPSYRHQQSVKTLPRATYLARSAYVLDVATKAVVKKQISPEKKTKTVGRGPMLNSEWLPKEECGMGPLPACSPSAYRTVDGSCNNLYKPNEWGVGMRPFRRQLPADYADGVSSPKVASDGSSLPAARDVSTTVHRPAYRDDPKFTVMLAVWGQFLDHDITATALTTGAGGKTLSCCDPATKHPECYPVELSKNDTYYEKYGVTCMEFIRSAPAPTCALGPREQMNQVSSFIDGSVVYGNTVQLSRTLRTFQGGKLKMSLSPDGRELLPISTDPNDGCNREEENAKGRYCFIAGDLRANENLHLTSLHLLMARQHNILAQKLDDLNPDWSDEQIYQETRKIVSAQMQHISYNEFLPVILGPEMMENLEMNPKQSGYYTGYNASVDPTISNSFATSSFRFAHTLLPGLMKVLSSDTSSEEFVELHKMLFNPYSLYSPGYLDMALRGAINTKVTQRLFESSVEKPAAPKYGLDLVSLNVQRGRDHGLPSYPEWREFCGLSKPETFDDLEGVVDQGSLDKMKSIYKSVNDVDMYTGALSEIPIEGGMLGATVTCLISDQFKRLKDGDSYWSVK